MACRLDLPFYPPRDAPSMRAILLEAVEATLVRVELSGRRLTDALTKAFTAVCADPGEFLHVIVSGHGPFDFETGRKVISLAARGPAKGVNLGSTFQRAFDRLEHPKPIGFRVITDAVAVARAGYWARYNGDESSRSYTIASLIMGTGVGGALVQKYGRAIGRAHHSEFGHTRIHIRPEDQNAVSVCPHHGACLQGVCSWAALEARAGGRIQLQALIENPDDPFWKLIAKYIAQGCQTFMFTAPPYEIVLAGSLFDLVPKLPEFVFDEIQDETGPEFLYTAARDKERFLPHRALAQECLLGGLHTGLSMSQDAREFRLVTES